MAMGGVLLRRAALCTRRHLRLSPAAPLLATATATGTAAVQKQLCSDVVETKLGGEEVPDLSLKESFIPGGWDVRNRYLFAPCDLQQLIEQHSKGDVRVLPLITEEIVFRRLVRLSKRAIDSNNNSNLCMGYYLAVGSGLRLADVIPTSKVEDERFLHPQFRRIIHHLRFIEAQSTKEVASEDATKWKGILREVRPSCYDLLSSSLKRTLVYVCVELGEMCERGEMKGDDAYDLLKHIVEDMEGNRDDEWSRYETSYII